MTTGTIISKKPPLSADDLCATASQYKLNLWAQCQARFYYSYVLGIWGPPSPAMAFGTAIDETFNRKYVEKRRTGENPSVKDSQDLFASLWDEPEEEVGDWGRESKDGILDEGVGHVKKWATEVAPNVIPFDVQKWFELDIGGCRVRGVIDLTMEYADADEHDAAFRRRMVKDHKVSGKRWGKKKAGDEIQAVFYSFAGLTGQLVDDVDPNAVEYEVMVRNKTPSRQRLVVPISNNRRMYVANLIQTQRTAWRAAYNSGAFPPNRGHFMCSRRNCPHWRRCEIEHGGFVAA